MLAISWPGDLRARLRTTGVFLCKYVLAPLAFILLLLFIGMVCSPAYWR